MGWNDHFCEPARDPEDVKFEEAVDEAYNVLWNLFRPEEKCRRCDGTGRINGVTCMECYGTKKTSYGCDFSSKKEESLHRILNFIDSELGR